MGILRQLRQAEVRRKLFYDRLAEPLHLNLFAAFFAVFGSYRRKVEYDLIPRPQNAYGVLRAADCARESGLSQISIVEFGVAAGAGLMNLCRIAQKVSAITGVKIDVYGFDTGKGMPAPLDHRDHPDLYIPGDFPMDVPALERIFLPTVTWCWGNFLSQSRSFWRNV